MSLHRSQTTVQQAMNSTSTKSWFTTGENKARNQNACQRTNAATVGKSSGGSMQFTKYRKFSLMNQSACECLNHGDIKKC